MSSFVYYFPRQNKENKKMIYVLKAISMVYAIILDKSVDV